MRKITFAITSLLSFALQAECTYSFPPSIISTLAGRNEVCAALINCRNTALKEVYCSVLRSGVCPSADRCYASSLEESVFDIKVPVKRIKSNIN